MLLLGLACATLLAPADALLVPPGAVRPPARQAEAEAPEEACHTAVPGEECYRRVHWAMHVGISRYPSWYPGLTAESSTLEDFQRYIHEVGRSSSFDDDVCARPCARGALEAEEGCRTAVPGEDCYRAVEIAMSKDIVDHPSWYPGLTRGSTFEEFQAFLHGAADPIPGLDAYTCSVPCAALGPAGRTDDAAMPADAAEGAVAAEAAAAATEWAGAAEAADAAAERDAAEAAGADAKAVPPRGAEAPLVEEDEEGDTTFEIGLTKEDGAKLGIGITDFGTELRITTITSEGLVPDWNAKWPDMSVKVGDVVRKCNGIRGRDGIYNELRSAKELRLTIKAAQDARPKASAGGAAPEGGSPALPNAGDRDDAGKDAQPQAGADKAAPEDRPQAPLDVEDAQPKAAVGGAAPGGGPAGASGPVDPDGASPAAGGEDADAADGARPASGGEDDTSDRKGADNTDGADAAREGEEPPRDGDGPELGLPAVPDATGCYIWTPHGCPRQPQFEAQTAWKRDVWGEMQANSAASKKACQSRKDAINSWCGTSGAVTMLVLKTPPSPVTRGCYHWQPSGCPQRGAAMPLNIWKRDAYGEQSLGAAASEAACMARRPSLDSYCGTDDTRMLYVEHDQVEVRDASAQLAPPEEVGVREASARPAPPEEVEVRDASARPAPPEEVEVRDASARPAPPEDVEVEVREASVRPAPPPGEATPLRPQRPGCYVWLPTGCPAHGFKAKLNWLQDAWGQTHLQTADDGARCGRRKLAFDQWCRVDDAVMLHVPRGWPAASWPARGDDFMADAGLHVPEPARGGAAEAPAPVWMAPEDLPPPEVEDRPRAEPGGPERAAAAPAAQPEAEEGPPAAAASPAERQPESPPAAAAAPAGRPEAEAEDPPLSPPGAGCFVWLPSGCMSHHFLAKYHWRRDEWGEASARAADDAAACEARKAWFDAWCDVADAVMLHVPYPADPSGGEAPPTPGEQTGAHGPRQAASQDQIAMFMLNRGPDAEVPELPEGSGCFVWLPSGCRGNRFKAMYIWKRDVWGEVNKGAGGSAAACKLRKSDFDGYCGVQDAVMMLQGLDAEKDESLHLPMELPYWS